MKHPTPGDGVSRETHQRLEAFAALLSRWNHRINLVSRGDVASLMSRHVADSLQLAPFIRPSATHGIDLGSGGGFPGLVLAIATGKPFDLIESDARKAAFLQEAIRVTAAPAKVHVLRVEDAKLMPAPLITARAFAPVARVLQISIHLVAPGGIFLLPKGVAAEDELTEARARWHMRVEKFASQTGPGATILRLSEVARA